MKTHLVPTLASAALLAFLAPVTSVVAQNPAPPLKLEVLTPQSEAYSLSHIAGKALHSANQEQLGELTDFLIEPSTGQVHYAIVPTGTGPSGQTFRLVPMTAVDAGQGADHVTIRLGRDQWDRVGTMTEREVQASVSLNAEQQQRFAQQFGMAASNEYRGAEGLIRASSLRGREVRSGSESFGTVEDVVIDLNNRRAAPILALHAQYGAGQKFLVPFDRLQLSGPQNTLMTNLSRWDFQQLQRTQGQLAPTGYPNNFGQGRQQNFAALSAVQQAIARDQAASGVQVVPESRLVLRGTVPNEQKKAEVERAASQAAPGVRIDSELTVRGW